MSSRHRNAEALLNLMIVKDKMFEQMGDAGFPTKIWICLHKPDFKHVGTKTAHTHKKMASSDFMMQRR